MSKVATHLMMRFGIRESSLPCLLFTDGGNLNRHIVAPLDRNDPLKSLYYHVLAPLSEEFAILSRYWERRQSLPWKRSAVERAKGAVETLPDDIQKVCLEIATELPLIDGKKNLIISKIEEMEIVIDQQKSEHAQKVQAKRELAKRLADELRSIENGTTTFRSTEHKILELKRLRKKLSRKEQSAADCSYHSINTRETRTMPSLERDLSQLKWRIPDLERKKKNLEQELADAKREIRVWSDKRLLSEENEIGRMEKALARTPAPVDGPHLHRASNDAGGRAGQGAGARHVGLRSAEPADDMLG